MTQHIESSSSQPYDSSASAGAGRSSDQPHDSSGPVEPGRLSGPSGSAAWSASRGAAAGSSEPSAPSGVAGSSNPSGSPVLPASPGGPQVTLRGPADLAEALPYLLGFHPDDSVVMIGLHGARGRFGARLRVGIPSHSDDWPETAAQLGDCVVNGAGPQRRPDGVALFLCQDPREGETPTQAMERLRPLAQYLRESCGALDVPVIEALCLTAGRWWSYTCPTTTCCPPEGTPLTREGTSVMAAAAAYAGVQVRGSLREMEARLLPLAMPRAESQQRALDDACAEYLPRMLGEGDCETVREETLALSGAALERFRAAPPAVDGPAGDAHDDALLGDDEAAAIILGLQDRETRDMAAEWMEVGEATSALRLWRALARRCVGVYADHAAAPLTLAGWVSWSSGDEASARVAFSRALNADPDYTFAKLLHQACNHGLDPEPLRHCLRQERGRRLARAGRVRRPASAGTGPKGRQDRRGPSSAGTRPGGRTRTRTRRPARTPGDDPEC